MQSPHLNVTDLYRLDLHFIKALFLHQHYRRCIQTCREVLLASIDASSEPSVLRAFVHFYLALSHDELARAMHPQSQARITAFDQAERLYQQALDVLPPPQQSGDVVAQVLRQIDDDRLFDRSSSISPSEGSDSLPPIASPGSTTVMRSPPTSPWRHTHYGSPQLTSLSMQSPNATTSDAGEDDRESLQSHPSFSLIMTPKRVPQKLPRDFSSISLLQPPRRQKSSQSIRPLEPGSPPTPYHLPLESTLSDSQQYPSKLPQFATKSPSYGPPVRGQLRTRSEQVSPVPSPVSPLGSAMGFMTYGSCAISPVSPEAPRFPTDVKAKHRVPYSRDGLDDDNDSDVDLHHRQQDLQLRTTDAVEAHLTGLRTQLNGHIALVRTAKLQTRQLQISVAATTQELIKQAAAGTLPSPISSSPPAQKEDGMALPLCDSETSKPRSFAPATACRSKDISRRICEGRARDWVRKRVEAAKYEKLAEEALAEL